LLMWTISSRKTVSYIALRFLTAPAVMEFLMLPGALPKCFLNLAASNRGR